MPHIILWDKDGNALIVGEAPHKGIVKEEMRQRAEQVGATLCKNLKDRLKVVEVIHQQIEKVDNRKLGRGIIGRDGIERDRHPQRKYPLGSYVDQRLRELDAADVPTLARAMRDLPGKCPSTFETAACVSMKANKEAK